MEIKFDFFKEEGVNNIKNCDNKILLAKIKNLYKSCMITLEEFKNKNDPMVKKEKKELNKIMFNILMFYTDEDIIESVLHDTLFFWWRQLCAKDIELSILSDFKRVEYNADLLRNKK